MITTLHLAPEGSDNWNGLQPQPNTNQTDGPLGSFEGARKRVRQLREQNMTVGTVTVKVQPGHYRFSNPLSFEPCDKDIIFLAEGGEVIVDGAVEVEDFHEAEVNGRFCWVADIPHLLAGRRLPRSLYANGERRLRSRFPKEGMLEIEAVPDHQGKPTLFKGAASRFTVAEGDFDPAWRNPQQIEAVINHLWIEERMPVASYEPEKRRLSSTHRSVFTLKNCGWMGDTPCAKYYFENVFEAMTEPGEWYIDPAEERLYYLPKPGESIATTKIQIPLQTQLLRFHGDYESGRKVEGIHFEDITFQHTDWSHPEGWGKWWDPQTDPQTWRPRDSFKHFNANNLGIEGMPPSDRIAAVPQAAHDLPGAISFEAATNCSLRECSFRGIGFYAIDIRAACSHLRIQGNRFADIGGGGVKIDGAERKADDSMRTHRIYVGDNSMQNLGEVFPAAVGVCICHSDHNLVEHNEISNLYYTAISVGWTWGYDENPAHNNIIQYNYLHDVGQGRLSDMGAIYTLGVQPGTVIRGNHIHDVKGSHYGGWGIYLDEASSLMRVEQNLVYRTKSQCFHEHWGRGNVVCDNVFALSGSECAVIAREEHDNFIQTPAKGDLFLRNVFLTKGTCAYNDSMAFFETELLDSDLNLFWDLQTQAAPGYVNQNPWPMVQASKGILTLDAAQASGRERHSVAADPGFKDPTQGDFSVNPESPALDLGIKLLDTSRCGPRPSDQRMPSCAPSFRPKGDVIFTD